YKCYAEHTYLYSFPTRRSSDLTPIIYILTDEMHFMDTLIEEQCMVELKRWRGENPDTAVTESVPAGLIKQYAASKEETIKEPGRSEEHTSELQSRFDLVCRLLL